MKIFVTGATGYIGGSVAERLVRDGHLVTGLARSAEATRELEQRSVRPVIGTLDDADVVVTAVREADAVINAAEANHPDAVRIIAAALAGSGKALQPCCRTSNTAGTGARIGRSER